MQALEGDIQKLESIIGTNEKASAESKALLDLLKNSFDEAKKGNYEVLRKLHAENKMIADLAFKANTTGGEYAELVTVSFGIARILEESDRKFERLYSNADKALYVAKNRSANSRYIL